MPTCPFCGSPVTAATETYFCSFCEMEIPADALLQDGSRRQLPPLEQVASLEDAGQSTKVLLNKDSYYLTVLLRLVREERTKVYNYLRVFNKLEERPADLEDKKIETGREYEHWTRKMWTIENILRDRSGFYPERITDGYLEGLAANMTKSNGKSMRFMSRK